MKAGSGSYRGTRKSDIKGDQKIYQNDFVFQTFSLFCLQVSIAVRKCLDIVIVLVHPNTNY